jgi:hypothetical protein
LGSICQSAVVEAGERNMVVCVRGVKEDTSMVMVVVGMMQADLIFAETVVVRPVKRRRRSVAEDRCETRSASCMVFDFWVWECGDGELDVK